MGKNKKTRNRKPVREPQTHDYTRAMWGHALYPTGIWEDDNGDWRMNGVLFCDKRIYEGDYLILLSPTSGDGTTRYQVTELKKKSDPSDMYHYAAVFAPREDTDG